MLLAARMWICASRAAMASSLLSEDNAKRPTPWRGIARKKNIIFFSEISSNFKDEQIITLSKNEHYWQYWLQKAWNTNKTTHKPAFESAWLWRIPCRTSSDIPKNQISLSQTVCKEYRSERSTQNGGSIGGDFHSSDRELLQLHVLQEMVFSRIFTHLKYLSFGVNENVRSTLNNWMSPCSVAVMTTGLVLWNLTTLTERVEWRPIVMSGMRLVEMRPRGRNSSFSTYLSGKSSKFQIIIIMPYLRKISMLSKRCNSRKQGNLVNF